jgi:hypothetical protein
LYWKAYEAKNGPLGPVRGDYQAALIAKVIADVNSKKGRRNPFANFLLNWKRDKGEVSKGGGGFDQIESLGDPG